MSNYILTYPQSHERFSADDKPTLPEIQDAKNFVAQAHGRVFGDADTYGWGAKQGDCDAPPVCASYQRNLNCDASIPTRSMMNFVFVIMSRRL